MPTTVQDNALLTIEEGIAFLGTGSSDDEKDKVAVWINAASDYCEERWGRSLKFREYEDLRLPANRFCELMVPTAPINIEEDIIVKLDGITLSIWKSEADGDRATKDVLVTSAPGTAGSRWAPNVLYRSRGWFSSKADPEPILLTYTGGLDPLPENLKHAVKLLIQTFLRHQDKQLADVVQFSAGPVSPGVSFGQAFSLMPKWAQWEIDAYKASWA